MTQRTSLKPINNFVKGLVTEASILAFPEGASIDELNCDLERSGIRKRRRGFAQETAGELTSIVKANNDFVVHRLIWNDVAGVADLNFLVVQLGSILHFFDESTTPMSDGEKSFTIDMNQAPFNANNGISPANNRIQGDVVEGVFIIANPGVNTFYIQYDKLTDTISTSVINFRIRDFDWQGDRNTYNTTETNPTFARAYDTYNAGWTAGVVAAYQGGPSPTNVIIGNTENTSAVAGTLGAGKVYPPLTHPWHSGKNSSDQFAKSEWEKVGVQTSIIANGRFILDFFRKDRGARIGFNNEIETETARFRSVVSFAGRAWYAGLDSDRNGGRILYTQIVESPNDLGNCFQVADPTSEIDPDLVDSDGGVILIPEARNIKRLFVFSTYLVVFAQNGVWTINGVDGVFKATEYSVSKRSEVGIDSEASLVSADGRPLWWSKEGIHAMSVSEDLNLSEQNISIGVIQSFLDRISRVAKASVVGEFDRTNKIICWYYSNNDETIGGKFNNFLLFDLSLEAFYPWKIEDNANYIVAGFYTTGAGVDVVEESVFVETDEVLVGTDQVVVNTTLPVEATQPGFSYLYRDAATGRLAFGAFTSTTFLDFGTVNYSSYAEAGYDFQGAITLRGNAPYITTVFNRTETGYVGNEDDGYQFDFPSSCLMSVYWDQKTVPTTNRIQAYRYTRVPVVNPSDLTEFNAPYTTIITKNKVLGRGRVMRIRFESETGKDFQLAGWEAVNAVNRAI